MARESPEPGWLLLRKNMPAQPADIADEANVPVDDAIRAIELFKSSSYEMLAEENGVLRVINWAKRQFENDSSTARVRRYRERQNRQQSDEGNTRDRYGNSSCNVAGNDGSNVSCNVTETPLLSANISPQENCGGSCCKDGGGKADEVSSSQIEEPIVHEALQTHSPGPLHGNVQCNVSGSVSCNVARNGAGNVTLQNYRDTEDYIEAIEIKDISGSILSAPSGAEEPRIAPELSARSAPDGAVLDRGLSSGEGDSYDQRVENRSTRDPPQEGDCDESGLRGTSPSREVRPLPEQSATEHSITSHHPDAPLLDAQFNDLAKGDTSSSQNALSSSKLPDQIAIERLSPLHPCSTTHPQPEASKTHFIDPVHSEHPEGHGKDDRSGSSLPGALEGRAADEPSAGDRFHEASPGQDASSQNADRTHRFYLTKRRRKLSGWKLEAFEEFWRVFAHKKGRAEAADAWLDIQDLTSELAGRIIDAAGKEAKARPALVSKGLSPKWPQGWISARRWEDWEDNPGTVHSRDGAPGGEKSHEGKGSRDPREDDAQYRQSIKEAFERFL
jgi:hypothetical protein